MACDDFTTDSEVRQRLLRLREGGIDQKQFSDVTDDEGHQYVDLVLEGGGVLGIALLGYTYTLEQMGIRFHSVAGTSAGAINTILLAAFDPQSGPYKTSSEWVLSELCDQNLFDFVDGPSRIKKLIRTYQKTGRSLRLIYRGLRSWAHFKTHLGLNPGRKFEEWLEGLLKSQGITTTRQLLDRLEHPAAHIKARSNGFQPAGREVVLVSAELCTESRIQLPEMRSMFWPNADEINPAGFVRASMSIPGFFHPYKIELVHSNEMKDAWDKFVDYSGRLPKKAMLVDGGIVSNFPIDVFHVDDQIPHRPTFGVKLGVDRAEPRNVGRPKELASAMFDTARHVLDYEFLLGHPDYKQLVAVIPTGDHSWLNFELTRKQQVDLFKRGVRAAEHFLRKFDWQMYKETRQSTLPATVVA